MPCKTELCGGAIDNAVKLSLATHESSDDIGVKLMAGVVENFLCGIGGGQGGAIAAVASHRIVGVDNGEDPGSLADIRAAKCLWIPAAIPVFMVLVDHLGWGLKVLA